jgi:hypothetical protein
MEKNQPKLLKMEGMKTTKLSIKNRSLFSNFNKKLGLQQT